MKFLSKHSIADFLADDELTYKGIDKKVLKKHYKFSLEMIDLRYFANKNLKDFVLKGNYIKPNLDLTKFKELCKKVNIISLQSNKFVKEFTNKKFDHGIVLCNNSTDTKWFANLSTAASAYCFTNHRIQFSNVDGKNTSSNTRGQIFIYFGNDVELFKTHFSKHGLILKAY
jgi:hypothetical protein